jgi:hypothetical protein
MTIARDERQTFGRKNFFDVREHQQVFSDLTEKPELKIVPR